MKTYASPLTQRSLVNVIVKKGGATGITKTKSKEPQLKGFCNRGGKDEYMIDEGGRGVVIMYLSYLVR